MKRTLIHILAAIAMIAAACSTSIPSQPDSIGPAPDARVSIPDSQIDEANPEETMPPPTTWPFARSYTYSIGTPVDPNDLNEFQDAVVYNRHGLIEQPIPIAGAYPNPNWTWDDVGMVAPAAGWPRALYVPIPFSRGTTIYEITAWWNLLGVPLDDQDAQDYLRLTVWSRDPHASPSWTEEILSTQIVDDTVGDHVGDSVRYAWDLSSDPFVLTAGKFYRVMILAGNAQRRVDGLMADIART